ncbi:hypothetical protein, partial [Pantoea septica]
ADTLRSIELIAEQLAPWLRTLTSQETL